MNGRKLRLLVAIASYGEKNIELLKRIIAKYQAMPIEVDVVVLSNAPKSLGPRVEVVVGLPAKNPWSLPFGHKPIFAKRVNDYDLFVYSEDDMEVTEQNIKAFLSATSELANDEIAGYLRYEVDKSGVRSLPDAHGAYHWKAETAHKRGSHVVAEFTNEHAAFFLLTQAQLKRAIASGGFLREPCEGRYDMLCTAATDPYTNCGFRKVICATALEDFLIHHMSNRYTGQYGLTLAEFRNQVTTLVEIANGAHPASTLFHLDPIVGSGAWAKSYYEKPIPVLLEKIPANARTILSVGSGSGETEAELISRGLKVTALPLDSVIGPVSNRPGLELIYGNFGQCQDKLNGRTFDCVIATNFLHLVPNPAQVLEGCAKFVAPGGTLLAMGPNFGHLKIRAKRLLGRNDYQKLGSLKLSGINACGPGELKQVLRNTGFGENSIQWLYSPTQQRKLGGLNARSWLLAARRG